MRGRAGESTSGYHGKYGELHKAVERDALLDGDFILSSEQSTSFYFDSKRVTLDPEGAFLVGQAFIETIKERAPAATAIGGLTLGADPIVSSIVLLSRRTSQPLKGLIVRKEPKSHGTKRWVEGPEIDSVDVVVVDDVVTSGESVRLAVKQLREAKMRVVLAIALIDRLAGFKEAMAEMDVPSTSIFTRQNFDRTADPQESTAVPHPEPVAI